ncbi:hypothetical protein T484DRAFT_1906161 [Baffinella frigidus]|nr:hypothetical protein T484DRAFT_1906161 [Cryptophyta sp. CCMP2293]
MPTAAVSPPKLPGLKGLTGYGKTATEIVEDLAAQSEATAGERAGGWFVRMRDAGAVRGKLEKFIAEGPEQTQVVTDFDLTMTKMFLSNGAHGASSHAMFESYSGFDEAYRTDMQALFHKYYPIEKDPLDRASVGRIGRQLTYRTDMQTLFHKYYPIEKDPLVPHAEKMGHMNTWWETAHSRMLQQGLNRGVVTNIVTNGKDSKLALR